MCACVRACVCVCVRRGPGSQGIERGVEYRTREGIS